MAKLYQDVWKGGSLQSKHTHAATDGEFLAGDETERHKAGAC